MAFAPANSWVAAGMAAARAVQQPSTPEPVSALGRTAGSFGGSFGAGSQISRGLARGLGTQVGAAAGTFGQGAFGTAQPGSPRGAFGSFGTPPRSTETWGSSALAKNPISDAGRAFGVFAAPNPPGSADTAFGTSAMGTGDGNQVYGVGAFPQAGEELGQGNQPGAMMNYTGGTVGAPFTPQGGRFAGGNLDPAAAEINAASAAAGVPANFLAVIIAKESSGDWNRWQNTTYHRGQPIMGYIGVYQDAATTRGLGDLWNRAHGNRGLQIELLARVLRSQYDQLVRQHGAGKINWLNVASYHYSGNPFGGAAPADSVQHGSSDYYMNHTRELWSMLEPGFNPNAQGVGAPMGQSFGTNGGAATGYQAVWGGKSFNITQEHGPTAFSLGAGAWMYEYASSLGMQGHPGIDVGMPIGTPIFSATSGTVVTTGSGYYRDTNGGVGEIKVKLDNGDEIIYGHMSRANVRIGQRVTPGMQIGASGTMNGPHLHLEYRRRTPGATSSGYTAVDPRSVLTGGFIPGGAGGFGGGATGQLPSAAPQRTGRYFWNVPFSQLFSMNTGAGAGAGHFAGDGHNH